MERILLVCREGSASSIISILTLALETKKAGQDVDVLFTEEGLIAVCLGVFDWPRQFRGQALRLRMADNGPALGLPTMGGKGEARQLDARQLVLNTVKAGVPVYASGFWTKLMGLQGQIPEGIKMLELDSALERLESNSARMPAI